MELKRTRWLTKISPKAKITSKEQKVLKCVAFVTGSEDWFNVNRTAKNTDKLFENIILCLDQLPLKIQFTLGKENTENPGSESRSEHATSME